MRDETRKILSDLDSDLLDLIEFNLESVYLERNGEEAEFKPIPRALFKEPEPDPDWLFEDYERLANIASAYNEYLLGENKKLEARITVLESLNKELSQTVTYLRSARFERSTEKRDQRIISLSKQEPRLTQQEIADRVKTTRETVNRVINRNKKAKKSPVGDF